MFERDVSDGVSVVRMTHGRANAVDVTFCGGWLDLLEEERAGSSRALMVTGRGGIFSAGVDLLQLLEGGEEYARALIDGLSSMIERLFLFPKPVVMAVNGHAIAGGCVLACTADYRVAAEGDYRIGVPELLVGLPFPAWPLGVMDFAVPPARRASSVLCGKMVGPGEAVEHGFVDEVVSTDRLLERGLEVTRALADVPAESFWMTKAQLREPTRAAAVAVDGAFRERVVAAWCSPEARAAVRVHVERTLGGRGPGGGASDDSD